MALFIVAIADDLGGISSLLLLLTTYSLDGVAS